MSWNDYDPDDRDNPQPRDLGWDDEDEDLVNCPTCNRAIREDAPRCPHCGQWVLDDTPAAARARGWFWPVMIALLIAVILVMWHRLGR